MSQSRAHIAWYVWPFWALWRLVTWIVVLAGRLVAVVLGGVLMLAGFLVSLTVIGTIIGVPLFILGFLIVIRGLF